MENTKEHLMKEVKNIPREFLNIVDRVIEDRESEIIEQMRGFLLCMRRMHCLRQSKPMKKLLCFFKSIMIYEKVKLKKNWHKQKIDWKDRIISLDM